MDEIGSVQKMDGKPRLISSSSTVEETFQGGKIHNAYSLFSLPHMESSNKAHPKLIMVKEEFCLTEDDSMIKEDIVHEKDQSQNIKFSSLLT